MQSGSMKFEPFQQRKSGAMPLKKVAIMQATNDFFQSQMVPFLLSHYPPFSLPTVLQFNSNEADRAHLESSFDSYCAKSSVRFSPNPSSKYLFFLEAQLDTRFYLTLCSRIKLHKICSALRTNWYQELLVNPHLTYSPSKFWLLLAA